MYYRIIMLGIKGSENPENIMVVGGHLDSWDLADGSRRWGRCGAKYGSGEYF
jgi:hypothetical protein